MAPDSIGKFRPAHGNLFNFPADSMERRGSEAASYLESKVEFSLIFVLQPIYFPSTDFNSLEWLTLVATVTSEITFQTNA